MKVTAQAPCRIGLLGGGTDVGEYASKYGGICINLAINIKQKVEVGDQIENQLLDRDNPDFFKQFVGNLLVKHTFDNQTESGLGSSAALAVALTASVAKIEGRNLNKNQIAEEAWNTEVNKLGLFGGKQDQYASVYGGANLLLFEDRVYRYALEKEKIEKLLPYMCLFHLGKNREVSNIQDGLKTISTKQKIHLDRLKDLAYQGLDLIDEEDPVGFGYLMDEAWENKKQSNAGISNLYIGKKYERARSHGAIGGKVLGAGGGGHMLFFTQDREKLISGMKDLKHIPFEIDWEGLKVE